MPLLGLLAAQVSAIDLTAIPLGGSVFMQSISGPGGYSQEWQDAFGSATCYLDNVTVCAYDVTSNKQVACVQSAADGSYELGVVVGMTVLVNASYADHNFTLVSEQYASASIYVVGPITGLDFQVRPRRRLAHAWAASAIRACMHACTLSLRACASQPCTAHSTTAGPPCTKGS